MKRQNIIVLLLMLGLALPVLAQKKDQKEEDRIQLARDKYAEGLSIISTNKQYEKDDIPAINYTTVVRKQNWAGAGMTNDKMEFYYHELGDEEGTEPLGYQLAMVRRTYNMGSMEYFEEYVYDDEVKPLFWYAQYGYREGKTFDFVIELRGYYYADGTLARTICKKTDKKGELKACSIKDHATEYIEETLESDFDRALTNFKKFSRAFQALYDVEY